MRGTCVELVRKDNNEVFFRVSGKGREDLERVVVDLTAHQGREIFIRLVNRESGDWGHINFDDFRLYDTRPQVPPRQRRAAATQADVFAHAGLAPKRPSAP